MIYEMQGTRKTNGKEVRVRVKASTAKEAIATAVKWGVIVDVGSIQAEPSALGEALPPGEHGKNIHEADAPQASHLKRNLILGGVAVLAVVAAVAGVAMIVTSRSGPGAGPIKADVPKATWAEPLVASKPLPAHVVQQADGSLAAAPGYDWTTAAHTAVRWVPGKRHSMIAHIAAAQEEGRWNAEAGYVFGNGKDFDVHWAAGRLDPDHPHIKSIEREGYWIPDDGYAFVSQGDMAVRWVPGNKDSQNPHVEAGEQTDKWRPEAGYVWAEPNDPKSMAVIWKANIVHPKWDHVISSTTEGKWNAANGYQFANDIPGNFSVAKIGPTDEQIKSGITKIVVALIADGLKGNKPPQNFGDALAIELLKKVRDEAIRSALGDVFPGERQATLDAAANLISLAVDGRLTADDWASANTRDALVQRLRDHDPSAANAEEVAEFIGQVMKTYGQRR